MNPLTLVKRIQSINAKEADLGISDQASWHAKYKDSAYVFVGGIPYDLTEGDLLAVFAQYGEIVDVNLVRDKASGKSKGFAFIAYEDQRSTILAVDNLNGAQIAGRIIRVDHVSNYKKKEEEDEETERQKREERGVCRAFQRGECKYGDSCRFSHDEQRAANTGWGPEEDRKSRWAHDKFDNRSGVNKRTDAAPPSHAPKENRADDYDRKRSRGKDITEIGRKQIEANLDLERRDGGGRPEYEEGRGKQTVDRRSSRYEPESKSRDNYDGRVEKRSRRYETDSTARENQEEDGDRDRGREREREKRSSNPRDSSLHVEAGRIMITVETGGTMIIAETEAMMIIVVTGRMMINAKTRGVMIAIEADMMMATKGLADRQLFNLDIEKLSWSNMSSFTYDEDLLLLTFAITDQCFECGLR